jgi:DNA-binding NarL/FixJ family response regulator
VLLVTRDPARADGLAEALRELDLAPELTCSEEDLIDEQLAAAVLDGYPTAPTLRAMADATSRRSSFPILVLGPTEPDLEPLIALASGAAGYLAADATADEVGTAVVSLLDGDVVLPPSVAASLVHGLRCNGRGVVLRLHDGAPMVLTHREWEILVLLRQDRSTAEIATHFVIAQGTVRTHVSTIVRKLGADGRASLGTTG